MWHVTSAPRDKGCTISNCHVTKTMPLQRFGGVRNLFQTKKVLQGCHSIFFFAGTKIKTDSNYRDENHIYAYFFVKIMFENNNHF